MLALYRSGRQADALAAYRDARRTLVDELGIEPGRAAARGARADPDAGRGARPPPDRRNGAAPCRAACSWDAQRELAALVGALDDALAGRGRLVLIAGEPGIGKSRLADELVRDAEARGARVLIGRCWEAGGAPAYWPWVQSLRSYIRETEPEALRAQLGAGASDLAQLLPELREIFPELPEPIGAGLRGCALSPVRGREHASCATRHRPARWCSRSTTSMPRTSRRCCCCDLSSGRWPTAGSCSSARTVTSIPRSGDPLSAALAELVREPPTTQLQLAGLSEADVADYIELSTGIEPAPELARGDPRRNRRQPVLCRGRRAVCWPTRAASPKRTRTCASRPRSAQSSASAWADSPSAAASLLVPACGDRPGVRPRCAGGGSASFACDEVLDVLHEAMAERVVDEVPGTPGRLRFGHALIRDTLYDELTPARRFQLHRQAGEALEALYASDLEPHLAELAHHFLAAAPVGGADKAVDYARRAGDRAAAQLAYEEAVRHYEMALTLLGEDGRRCELLLALGDAQARAGDAAASNRIIPRGRRPCGRARAERAPGQSRARLRRQVRLGGVRGRRRSRAAARACARRHRGTKTARCGSGCSLGSRAVRCATPVSRRRGGAR